MTQQEYQKQLEKFKELIKKWSDNAMPQPQVQPQQKFNLNDTKTLIVVQQQLDVMFKRILADEKLLQQNKPAIHIIMRDLVTLLHNYVTYSQHPQFKTFLENNLKLVYSKIPPVGYTGNITFPKKR